MEIHIDNVPSPCYTLIEDKLVENLKLLSHIQDRTGVKIICALKGYAMWSTFPLVRKYLSGATASSLNEARLIHEEMGVKAHTYCPVYSPEDFHKIVQLSSHITFNSLSEYARHRDRLMKLNPKVNTGIRVNPEYSEITTDLYNPAIPLSRLGVTRSDFGDELPEGVNGLHFHLLCEQDSRVLERVLNKTEQKFGDLFSGCKWINIGGGHLITRKGYDVEHLISLLKDFRSRYPDAEIIMEPGEAVGWETGYLVSTVLDIISRGELKIAMLDVSFAAHMPDTLEMPYKPGILGAVDSSDGKYRYIMGGTTCLAGDFMGDYYFEKELQQGDKIVFTDMIHYTMVKTTFFNGVNHPHIGKIDTHGRFHLIKSFGYEDFKSKLS